MTMKLGEIETTGFPGRRDAFHSPAVLVNTTDPLHPGDSVRFTDASYTKVVVSKKSDRHAIVDPFLKEIKPGDLFWVLLMPGLAIDLTHLFVITTDAPAVEPREPEYNDDLYLDGYDRMDRARCRSEGCSGY